MINYDEGDVKTYTTDKMNKHVEDEPTTDNIPERVFYASAKMEFKEQLAKWHFGYNFNLFIRLSY